VGGGRVALGVGAELAGLVAAASSPDQLLVGIVELAAREVPGAVSASVALTASALGAEASAADERAARLEARQLRDGAGPGLDALKSAHTVEADDLRSERRWPAFARAATAEGVLAVRAVPMRVRGGAPLGVLTVHGGTPGAFGVPARWLTDRIAGYATVAVAGTMRTYDETTLSAGLRQALSSRSAIDQAVGIVMAERGSSPEEALAVLHAAARERGTTLNAVAARLVADVEAPHGR